MDILPEPTETEAAVPKRIGLRGGVSFILGTIIGSGIFVSSRGVAFYCGSVSLTLLVWALCGFISLLGTFCYAELGTVIKSSGAEYTYLNEAYGPLVSFQFSWISSMLINPGCQATLALTFAEYMLTPDLGLYSFGGSELVKKLIAVIVLLTLGAINIFSVSLTNRIQIIFTITKLLAVAVIVVGGVVMLVKGHSEHFMKGFEGSKTSAGMVMTAFYSNMNTANFMTEEMEYVERNLTLAISIGVPFVIIIYLLINTAYFSVLSLQENVQSETVALAWADNVIPSFSWAIPIFVAFSCFGSCNGSIFTSGRLINIAAQNHHLPSILSMVHVTRFTPVTAIITNVFLSILITLLGSVSSLIDLMGFVQWLFFGLCFLSVIIFRYKEPYSLYPRPIKVPLVVPAVCLIFSLCLVLIPLITSPQIGYFFVLAFILLGYLIYIPLVHYQLKLPLMDRITGNVQFRFNLLRPERKNI